MSDVIYSIDVRVSQHEDCNIGSIIDVLNAATNGNVNLVDVRRENENEENKYAIYKILAAKDERITHLLGLLGQASDVLQYVAEPGSLATQSIDIPAWAKIVLAKIEKEKAK